MYVCTRRIGLALHIIIQEIPSAELHAYPLQAASSYNQKLMSFEGIQTMVNAVTSAGADTMVFIEHKMLGVSLNSYVS